MYYREEANGRIVKISMMEWAKGFEKDRTVMKDRFKILGKDILVSTVFMGLDHSFFPGGSPLIYETMIFGGEHDEYQERYSTKEQAETGHAVALGLAKDGK